MPFVEGDDVGAADCVVVRVYPSDLHAVRLIGQGTDPIDSGTDLVVSKDVLAGNVIRRIASDDDSEAFVTRDDAALDDIPGSDDPDATGDHAAITIGHRERDITIYADKVLRQYVV